MFQYHYWYLFKLYQTALILAAEKYNGLEFVKALLAHEGIDVNVKDVYLFSSIFISLI